jgi:hypothetical protein
MSNSIFFFQDCPTCGRRLRVCVEYLGKKVMCEHCHGTLVARDPASGGIDGPHSEHDLLRRAEALLHSLDSRGLPERTPLSG